ncbi:metallopeptidase family protein [Sphingomicrobium astaxanthinifaciens]|uniref:metallopeptidase family protein n=1 Tax=Sphingomicrobium astaxanthinifaciens TaxID=1227949 RepID=UPI001FCAC2C6|nr:metallopeptidase family protein [Sphingomicrobium astaxanthinifaciens]MCJ7421031.1 metallopeptidase family protein [Sphingomicrobium astaxanthinifaciens]
MERAFGPAPSAAEMEAIARAAYARLPADFTRHLGDVVMLVEDFADAQTLAEMGIEDAYELTGLYEGLPLTERSIEHSGTLPDKVRLFRLPILLEWIERGDETLEHLIAHVLIHEIGHHFGFSDEDMHALEELA